MRPLLKIVLVLGVLVLVAGCSNNANTSSSNVSFIQVTNNLSVSSPPETNASGNTLTPISAYAFPGKPLILPSKYQSTEFMGSFADSFIGSYECSDGSETYTTNYTLFTGSEEIYRIHYTLVPVKDTENFQEVPVPADIRNFSISPDDFIALPDHIYSSQVMITVGPNVTGESGSNWAHNPYFPFLLRVTVDGHDASGADDQLTVTKLCYFMSQTRNMQPSPDIGPMPQSDIVMKPNETQVVNLTVRNFGGGIRELYFKIPARINASGWTFPLEADPGQLLVIPEGMHFILDPPVFTGNNFRLSNDTLEIISDAITPAGNYTFPLVLCFRNLNTDNTTSPYFPFDDNSYCATAAQFNVDIV